MRLTFSSYAQNYNFKSVDIKTGLGDKTVNSIAQDKRGFYWIGTENGGLQKFDGKTFQTFTKKNGLPSNLVKSIVIDSANNIWFSIHADGAGMYNGKTFTFFNKKNGLLSEFVNNVFIDKAQNIWFCTDSGLSEYSNGKFKHYTTASGLPVKQVFCINQDNAGVYYIGTVGGGLCTLQEDKIKVLTNTNSNVKTVVLSVLCLKNNLIYFSTFDGVYVWNGYTQKKIDELSFLKGDYIMDMIEDKEGVIWITSQNYGLIKYKNGVVKTINKKNGLGYEFISDLFVNQQNKLCISTYGSGIKFFNGEAIAVYSEKHGFGSPEINKVLPTVNSVIIITEAGNYLLDNTKEGNLIPVLKNKSITTSYLKKDKLFFADFDYNFYETTFSQEGNIKESLPLKITNASSIIDICADKNNTAWLATYGEGIYTVSKGIKQHQPFSKNNSYYCVQEAIDGTMYFGSLYQGLHSYKDGKFGVIDTSNGLAGNTIISIAEDKKGTLFLGTDADGLSIYNKGKVLSYTTDNGLLSDNVTALLVDSKNRLWVGSNKGIARLELNEKYHITNIKYYTEKNGLPGEEIPYRGIKEDENGIIWVATNNGLVRINTALEYKNTATPYIIINGVKLFYENIDTLKYKVKTDAYTHLPVNLSLPHNANHLTFEFQALTVDNMKYSYFLSNVDPDWSPPTEKNVATYPNISPGDYVFTVKAVNDDGYWSTVATYAFTIRKPFYQTWWFYLIVLSTASISIVSFIRMKTKRLQKQKKELEKKVDERTQELTLSNGKLSLALTDISDSINYAKKIQQAILPLEADFKKAFPQSFVLFAPRNVVSGDFYWMHETDTKLMVSAVDCTGHGVPGAFMSMIGNSILNEITRSTKSLNAAQILDELNTQLRIALKQDREATESKDGMDLAFCILDKKTAALDFSGAKRPLVIMRKNSNGSFDKEQIKGDRYSIGGMQIEEGFKFTNHTFQLNKGDRFYCYSDGYADQFGGPQGKKLTTKRMAELIEGVQGLAIEQQQNKLYNALVDWQGPHEQVDDVLVIGIEV